MSFKETSTVGHAKAGVNSLRATIPEHVVQALGVSEGDKLEWEVSAENSKFKVTVRKKKT